MGSPAGGRWHGSSRAPRGCRSGPTGICLIEDRSSPSTGQEAVMSVVTLYISPGDSGSEVSNLTSPIDSLDAQLIALLAAEPRIGVLECSRRLRVARGTVQARLDKLVARGVIRGFGPEIGPSALGYAVTAFVTLEIRQ